MDLQANGAFASKNTEYAFLVVTRQRAGFTIPMADFQVIYPGGDLGVLAGTADAAGVPTLHPPGLEPLLGGASVFINALGPLQGARVRACGERRRLAVGTAHREYLERLQRKGPSRHLAPQMADVAALVIIHIVLKPVSPIRAAKEDASVRAVIAVH